MKYALVTGAGGFIGSHLVNLLKKEGYWVRGVDLKESSSSNLKPDEFLKIDLRDRNNIEKIFSGILKFDEVYHLAANVGGVSFLEKHKSEIVVDNTAMNINMVEGARLFRADKFFFSSSCAVYPEYKESQVEKFREEDAYPAMPTIDGYGWEKLYMERICRHYFEDYGLKTYITRFFNIYGPNEVLFGDREKFTVAMCRKIINSTNELEIWGDGEQRRSYCYVKDCVRFIHKLVQTNYYSPVNICADNDNSLNEIVDCLLKISNKKLQRKYLLNKPVGTSGKNGDNTRIKEITGLKFKTEIHEGLEKIYYDVRQRLENI